MVRPTKIFLIVATMGPVWMSAGCGILPTVPFSCPGQVGCENVDGHVDDTAPGVVLPVPGGSEEIGAGASFLPFPIPPAFVIQPDDFGFDIGLSLLLDGLLLELLSPIGPRLPDSFTYLERLCLAGDEPDFYCRQRYGP